MEVPPGVEEVVEEPSTPWGVDATVEVGGMDGVERSTGSVGETVAVGSAGPTEVILHPPGAVDPWAVSQPAWRPWPLLRRAMTESRDRVAPLHPLLPRPGRARPRGGGGGSP
ncbi:MAG: hypothetical protein ACRDZ9_04345 [Acidimicrobiales bacterium]